MPKFIIYQKVTRDNAIICVNTDIFSVFDQYFTSMYTWTPCILYTAPFEMEKKYQNLYFDILGPSIYTLSSECCTQSGTVIALMSSWVELSYNPGTKTAF